VCLKAIDIVPDYPLLRMHLGQAYERESGYEEVTAENPDFTQNPAQGL